MPSTVVPLAKAPSTYLMPLIPTEPSPIERLVCATIAEAVGQAENMISLDPLPSETGHRVWRVQLAEPSPWGPTTLVTKLLLAQDCEASVLYWVHQKGRFGPQLYDAIPVAPNLQLLLLKDLGACGLPSMWVDNPRLLEGVVTWLTSLARLVLPDPLVSNWADWSSKGYAVGQFERAWHSIATTLSHHPGWVGPLDLVLLRSVYSRRVVLSQRLRSVSRRLSHGDLAPDHLRAVSDMQGEVAVRAVDWGRAGRGPLAFDVLDLVWALPEQRFEMALQRLQFALPPDVRSDLTPPVIRLCGEIKAFLLIGELARMMPRYGQASPEQRLAMQTALARLAKWAS